MFRLSKSGKLVQMAIFMAVGLLSVSRTVQAFVCPNATELSPCECIVDWSSRGAAMFCLGFAADVTQDDLNRAIAAVRKENNGALEMGTFVVSYTTLTELDLTPFEGGVFYYLEFDTSSLLSRVVGPDLSSTDWTPIRAERLYLQNNNFQDDGLQTVLSYFSRPEISYLDLNRNKLTGTLGQEFLPGFSNLSNVYGLILDDNNIRAVGGGQFEGMSRLWDIRINNNGLEEVGEDAFVIGQGSPTVVLRIELENNNLTDESFHPSSGIDNNRTVDLRLENNQFQRVREDQFLNFLEARPGNKLNFTGNPIWCDPEMKWLKDRREELEERVGGLNCVNDPGETAFTSSCVDGDCELLPECPPYEPTNPPTFYPGISCDTYYMCTEQGPILMNCRPPTLWDQSLKTCVPPEEADCEMKLTLK